jgi:uncharacterized membrane protein YfhO
MKDLQMSKKSFNPFTWRTNTKALWISFLLPTILMVGYFAYRHMAPFGSNSILTVDLGQQYVDFYAGFKQTLLHHPTDLIYSFTKGLGGETYGDWAYYLLSPFNLLLLPFSNVQLPAAIMFLTAIKYGFASLSMAFAVRQMRWQSGWPIVVFGSIYSMMGWFVANDLNLMWLDAAILLPLIVVGLERFIDGRSHWRFTAFLTLVFIVNYYMAYMVGLFLVLYLIWRLFWQPYTLKERAWIVGKFSFGAVMSIGLSTFIWLPTARALMDSKGQHMLEGLKNQFAYNPPDFISKFFLGTFNFEQMKAGLPNIFVGSFVLILVWFFFTYREIRWQTRLSALFVTIVLVVSMMYDPMNIAWHGFSFPVWYPYRFSFVFSFWLIWIAASVWSEQIRFNWRQLAGFLLVVLMGTTWVIYRLHHFDFLTMIQIIIGLGFLLMILLLQQLPFRGWWWKGLLGFVVILEMFLSTVWTLDNFSYLNNDEYQTTIKAINAGANKLPATNGKDFYRVAKSFQRTKGDPLQGDFNGASTFSSALEHQQSDFMAVIGQPEGDNYVTYDGGTLLTDSLLGMRYLMAPNDATPSVLGNPSDLATYPRFDTFGNYSSYAETSKVLITQNPNALPIAFAADQAALNFKPRLNDPLGNQNQLWSDLLGDQKDDVITSSNFTETTGQNVQIPAVITGAFLTKNNADADGSITLSYQKQATGPSYLTIGASISNEDMTITVDGKNLQAIPDHRHTIVLPLPNDGEVGGTHTIKLFMLKKNLWLQDVSLYTLDTNKLNDQATDLKAHSLKISKMTSTKIVGKIDLPQGSNLLMSTIPDARGWTIYVDGKKVNSVTISKFFLGAVTAPGEHTVEYRFKAPLLHSGGIVTIGFILFLVGLGWSENAKRRHSFHDNPLQ